MPEPVEETTVQVQRKSDSAFILFTPDGSCAKEMESAPNVCKIVYGNGYVMFGMPDRYTMAMLYEEFYALTENWHLMPIPYYKPNPQGWVLHETSGDG
jgi:hypothetical protein